jgi:hypothetical protein
MDIYRNILQKLCTVGDPNDDSCILVDKTDSTTFILSDFNIANGWVIRICKIVNKKIIIGDLVLISVNPKCFYDRCVYALDWRYENEEQRRVKVIYTCLVNILNLSGPRNMYLRYRKKGRKVH